MTNTESTLVVLIDADDVKHAFSGWPDHICLATCLTRDGDCSMVVFRRDERAAIPQRLMEMLALDAEDVCFVPQVSGFPTKPFLYSDERRLMALVSSDPDILDEAIDYAVNYTYALEEGLDPAMVLGRTSTSVQLPQAPANKPAPAAKPVPMPQSAPEPDPTPPPVAELKQEVVDRKPGAPSPLLPDFLRKSAEQTRRPKFASVRKSKLELLAS